MDSDGLMSSSVSTTIDGIKETVMDLFMVCHYGGPDFDDEKHEKFRGQLYSYNCPQILE